MAPGGIGSLALARSIVLSLALTLALSLWGGAYLHMRRSLLTLIGKVSDSGAKSTA